jgi:predicted TIM-barrel fold metal-dependent hydrolase
MRYQIGVDNIMWGSDYPHPEGTWPYTREQMRETFHGLPEEELAAMLGGNAIGLYGFDRDALARVAERIGPQRLEFAA